MSVIENAAANYRAATKEFLDAARAVPADQLDRRPREGWSARQIIHHLADSETQSYSRLRRLLAEPTPTIQGYDEEAWAHCSTLGYTELPVDLSIAVFESVRAASAQVIDRMTPADLEKSGQHTERGSISIAHWLDMYTRHPREHAQQLDHALRGEI
ncbi:MAG: DinB family protein [Candidatus Nanopelagicales bacterium]